MSLTLYRRPGSNVWHYRGTVGPPGTRKRLRGSTGTADKGAAAREAADIEARYWKGHHNGPGAIVSFDQACVMYLASGRSENFLAPVRKYFKDTPIKDVTAAKIRTMTIELFGHVSNNSKNRMGIAPVQSVINFCAENELCSPIKVKKFKAEPKEKEPATLEWVQAFMEHAKPHLGAYALFMFLTGCRPSEALAVDRDRDLNLQKATVIIRQTKTVRDRTVESRDRTAHLPPMLVAELANLPAVPGRPLFVYETFGALIQTWDSVIAAAKIVRLTPHCCRHGFATELLRRGIDVHTVAWLGGWASPAQVLATYGHAIKRRDLTNVLVGTQLTQAMDDVVASVEKVSAISR
jgi:integrase